MQSGITRSFDVQEWWCHPYSTYLYVYLYYPVCVVEVTSSPRTLLPWGFGFSACFVWNPRCMANVVEGALFCAGASRFCWRFCSWGVDYRLALSHLFAAPRCLHGGYRRQQLITAQTQWQIPGSKFLQDKWSAMASKEEDVQMMWLAVLFVPSWMPC